MKTRKLTVADLPKECLVEIVRATRIPIEEKMIARAIIEHRLNRAINHVKEYDNLKAAAAKERSRRNRRELEVQARRHAVNFTTLFESAKKLAEQYGQMDEYFKGMRKGKAGAGTPA